MTKTFAQLKRDLIVGKTLTMTFNALSESSETIKNRLNISRYIIGKQTNGITLSETASALKGSFLELPRASLVSYDDNTITVYDPAERPLTDEEKNILANMPSNRKENEEMVKQDIMQDMSRTYWLDKKYTKENDADWYWTESKGKYYIRHNNAMRDASIKGKISIIYQLN